MSTAPRHALLVSAALLLACQGPSSSLDRPQPPAAPPAPPGAPPAPAPSAHAPHGEQPLPAGTAFPPMAAQVLGTVFRDNAHFRKTTAPSYFDRFRDTQHPRATLVACADSRFHSSVLDHLPDDDLFVVRNIGNVIDNNPGSVEYGIRHLHTPLLLIVGHVGCGAVKAAMSDYEAESRAIRHELDALHLSVLRAHAGGSVESRWLANVLGNVRQQVRNAMRAFAAEVKARTLAIVGAVYDFRDDLKQGKGAVVVISVNGEDDPHKIEALPLVRSARAHALRPAEGAPTRRGQEGH